MLSEYAAPSCWSRDSTSAWSRRLKCGQTSEGADRGGECNQAATKMLMARDSYAPKKPGGFEGVSSLIVGDPLEAANEPFQTKSSVLWLHSCSATEITSVGQVAAPKQDPVLHCAMHVTAVKATNKGEGAVMFVMSFTSFLLAMARTKTL